MALTKAKRLYTSKKNSLIRLLDPIPTLLQDQSVGAERLVEARKGCKAAWEVFTATYDGLVNAQPKDEVQNADLEERDQEYGDLKVRYQDLLSALAGVIALQSRDRDAHRLQQERQAEADRLQQERLDQVNVCCLRIANLYGEAKESLTQLHDQLSLGEPPSTEQLVVGKYC